MIQKSMTNVILHFRSAFFCIYYLLDGLQRRSTLVSKSYDRSEGLASHMPINMSVMVTKYRRHTDPNGGYDQN